MAGKHNYVFRFLLFLNMILKYVQVMNQGSKDMLRFLIRRKLDETIPHNNDVNIVSGIKRAETVLTDLFVRLFEQP